MQRIALAPDLSSLSVTERRVIDAIASGKGRREAALSLHLSVHTVGHSLTSAKEKLFARTVAEAAAVYVRLAAGIVGSGQDAWR